ncbi:uncharacterized protein LOC144317091 [Canis aureus]
MRPSASGGVRYRKCSLDLRSRIRSHPGHLKHRVKAPPLKPDVRGVYNGSATSSYVNMTGSLRFLCREQTEGEVEYKQGDSRDTTTTFRKEKRVHWIQVVVLNVVHNIWILDPFQRTYRVMSSQSAESNSLTD